MSEGGLSTDSVFITGTDRGIGLEFVKQLTQLQRPPKHIFATCLCAADCEELHHLALEHSNVHIHQFDVRDYASYPGVVEWVRSHLEGQGLNVLINNAGIGQWQGFEDVTREHMLEVLETNTVAPLMIAKAFLPLLKQAAATEDSTDLSCSRAAVVNVSSTYGLVGLNSNGGVYAYRTSKAALNMVTKSMSVDLKPHGILVVAVSPGWTLTKMGGPNAEITTTTSVAGLLNVMAGLNEASAGSFIRYNGEIFPWS